MSRSTRWQWRSQLARNSTPRAPERLRFEALESRRVLATFMVTSLESSGEGSLREAIVAANANEGVDGIQFDAVALQLGRARTIALGSQLPTITDDLVITGPGADRMTIDAGNGVDGEFGTGDGFRIFDIDDGDAEATIDVTISGVTLTGGDTGRTDGRGFEGESGASGGAIHSSENLLIVESVITGNATAHGEDGQVLKYCQTSTACEYGFYSYLSIAPGRGGDGGGVWVEGADLTIAGSTITGNRAGDSGAPTPSRYDDEFPLYGVAGSGGGVGVRSGNLTITDSVLSNNASGATFGFSPTSNGGNGGAAVAIRGDLTIERSTLSGNTASSMGGGAAGLYGDVTIRNSTIDGNATLRYGGGGIATWYGPSALVVQNTTITGNHGFYGGGVYSPSDNVTISQSTVTGNSAFLGGGGIDLRGFGSKRIEGSIVAGNSDGDLQIAQASGTAVTYTLIGATNAAGLVDGENGNQVGTLESPIDPLLGPLSDNGGPTLTHALLPGSPARDAGDPAAVAGAGEVPLNDQRGDGFARVTNGRIDLGAVESPQVILVNDTGDADDGDPGNGVTTLREAINLANGAASPIEIGFDPAVFATPQTIELDSQLPVITGSLDLHGPGAELLTIDAGNGADGVFGTGDGFRIFDIDDGDDDANITVTVSGVTLTGGDAARGDAFDSQSVGRAGEAGGAIRSRENLLIAASVITGNAAGDGFEGRFITTCQTSCDRYSYEVEVAPGDGGGGGGIWVEGADLTITGSLVTDNRAGSGGLYADGPGTSEYGLSGSGGGIGIRDGDVVIADSVITGNSSGSTNLGFGTLTQRSGVGGGVYAAGFASRLSIVDSTITENRSLDGGGVGVFEAAATLRGSTVSGNEASGQGGGVYTARLSDRLELDSVTVSNNRITGPGPKHGGGIVSRGAGTTIARSTITGNRGGLLLGQNYPMSVLGTIIVGTILAGNETNDLSLGYEFDWNSLEVAYSLVGAAVVVGAAVAPTLVDGENGNQIGTPDSPIDPLLGPLADNGGPTLTHALLPGSPARNAGDPDAVAGADGVPLTDQRGEGFSRVLDDRIDIGAFEGVVEPPGVPGDFNDDGVVDGFDREVWAASFGSEVAPFSGADANGDGLVDAADYTVWRDNFTPRDVDFLRAPGPPVIDGFADPFWDAIDPEVAENTVFGSVDSPADASIAWRGAWDDEAFYFYAEVRDDRLVRDSQVAFEDDGVEIFFDPDFSRQTSYDGVDDTQLMLPLAAIRAVPSPTSPSDSADGVLLATGGNPNGPGYTIEAAIPWTALNASPEAGMLLGFEVALQDDDNGGGIGQTGEDGRRQWHGRSNTAFFRPASFGTAALSPQIAEVAAPAISGEATAASSASTAAAVEEATPRLVEANERTPLRTGVRGSLASPAAAAATEALLLIDDTFDVVADRDDQATVSYEEAVAVDEAFAADFGSDLL